MNRPKERIHYCFHRERSLSGVTTGGEDFIRTTDFKTRPKITVDIYLFNRRGTKEKITVYTTTLNENLRQSFIVD